MAYFTKQYTLTATATSLTTVMGFTEKKHITHLSVKGKTGNAAACYLGPSTVTNTPTNAGMELAAGALWQAGIAPLHALNSDEIFIVGTAADVAFITLIT